MFVIVRDERSDALHVLPRSDVVPTKKSSTVVVGDVVLHGPRTRHVRAVVVLIGEILACLYFEKISILLLPGTEEECEQSIEIIRRTTKVLTPKNAENSSIVPSNHASAEHESDLLGMQGNGAHGMDGFDSEDHEVENEEDEDLFGEENDKENDSMNISISPSPVLTTANAVDVRPLTTGFENLLAPVSAGHLSIYTSAVESSISVKRKTPPAHESSSSSANKRSKSLGFVSMREHATIVSQLAQMNEENMVLQTTWMRMFL